MYYAHMLFSSGMSSLSLQRADVDNFLDVSWAFFFMMRFRLKGEVQ